LARTHHTASELAERQRQGTLESGGEISTTRDAPCEDGMKQSIAVFDTLSHTQPEL